MGLFEKRVCPQWFFSFNWFSMCSLFSNEFVLGAYAHPNVDLTPLRSCEWFVMECWLRGLVQVVLTGVVGWEWGEQIYAKTCVPKTWIGFPWSSSSIHWSRLICSFILGNHVFSGWFLGPEKDFRCFNIFCQGHDPCHPVLSRTFSHCVLNVCTPVWASSLSKKNAEELTWNHWFTYMFQNPFKSPKQASVWATLSKMVLCVIV